jgi:alkylation response protein AidB-like acyl-CoA dehydrogenase
MPSDPHDLDKFRRRARQWLRENAPVRSKPNVVRHYDENSLAEARRFQQALHAAGLSGITWQERYGGQGLTPSHQEVFNEEAAHFDLPSAAFPLRITLAIIGPALLDHGSEEQKRRYLPEMLRGDALWVQLLSEPSAGSDLAALRMRALEDGGEWVLTGEKVWSSFGQYCDYAMVLARSDWDAPKHSGLTMFIVPMDTPGLSVLPLREISGDADFCQEFLDEVRVPASAVVGGVNQGWSVALSLFNHSRAMTSGAADTGPAMDPARGGDPDPGRDLINFATRVGRGNDPVARQLVAEAVIDNVVSGLLTTRVAATGDPALANISKVFGSFVLQRKAAIDLELRGESAIAWNPGDEDGHGPVHDYMFARTATIAGGSHEILMSTIGERILGLPKEPVPDRNAPFRELPGGPDDRKPS